jgi:UDP-N-acetylglucosamine acyltransferase
VVTGPCTFGRNNEIYPFAAVGGAPQDLRHRGEPTTLEVGDNNVFREYVTVGRGTVHGGGVTVIGNNNLFMAYCHIAHDCILGSNIVMANNATLAGHVQVQDYVVFGGMAAVGSFLRIGESAMIAAGSMLEKEVPPFCMAGGDRATLKGVNRVGLKRRGFSSVAKVQIKEIIKDIKIHSMSYDEIIAAHQDNTKLTPEAQRLLDFLKDVKRGITR